MRRKLAITLDERVYEESLVGPHVLGKDLDAGYREMARDEPREAEAADWAEGVFEDVAQERR